MCDLNLASFPARSAIPFSHSCRLRAVCALAVMALLIQSGSAQSDPPSSIFDSLKALTFDPHVIDDTGLCGGTVVDRFINDPDGQATGRKAVRLPDGDIVVAALVPRHGFGPPPNGMWSIGLVRYRLPCQHVPWSNAGPYGFPVSGGSAHRYLVYPATVEPQYVAIHDLKVLGQYLYVLVDRRKTSSISSVRDVYVLVFGLDGNFAAAVPAMDSDIDERGGGMAFFQAGGFPPPPAKLFVSGTYFGTRPVPTLARLTLSSGGFPFLIRDQWGPGGTFYMDYPQPNAFCVAAAQPCHAVANGIALTTSAGVLDRLYLGGAVRRNATGNWDFQAIAVNFDGFLVSGFGNGGRSVVNFDRGGNLRDVGTAIAARNGIQSNQVFLIGEVHQQTSSGENAGNRGIGIAKLTHAGGLDNSFGSAGRLVFGGCPVAPCSDFLNGGDAESFPRAVELAGTRLVVVGRERRRPQSVVPGSTLPHVDAAELSIVHRDHGALLDHASHIAHADLFSVLVEPDGRITSAGVFVENDLPRALTAQFRSGRLEGIFSNGFEQP